MARKRFKWLLWLAAVLLAPLPYLFMYDGAVPVIRYALLTVITASYSLFIDGSVVAWPMTIIMAAHALIYGLALIPIASLSAKLIPRAHRTRVITGLLAFGFVVALAFPIYATPTDDQFARTNWIGLFQ